MSSLPDTANNLAATLRQLRDQRGWTQRKLAEVSGVPRATLAGLETGSGNPTLSVLIAVSSALGVSLDELVAPPRATGRLYRAEELKRRVRGQVEVRALLPDSLPGVVVERMDLPAGSAMAGAPHKAGTREYLTAGATGASSAGATRAAAAVAAVAASPISNVAVHVPVSWDSTLPSARVTQAVLPGDEVCTTLTSWVVPLRHAHEARTAAPAGAQASRAGF